MCLCLTLPLRRPCLVSRIPIDRSIRRVKVDWLLVGFEYFFFLFDGRRDVNMAATAAWWSGQTTDERTGRSRSAVFCLPSLRPWRPCLQLCSRARDLLLEVGSVVPGFTPHARICNSASVTTTTSRRTGAVVSTVSCWPLDAGCTKANQLFFPFFLLLHVLRLYNNITLFLF